MARQAIKECKFPATLCQLSPPSSPSKRSAHTSTKGPSTILASFDAIMAERLGTTFAADPGSDSRSKLLAASKRTDGVHPFFVAAGVTIPQPQTATSLKPTSKHNATTSSTVATASKQAFRLTSEKQKDLTSNDHLGGPALPLYSYKDYSPEPKVVYTRHEQQANDLVQCLKGPLGFDMEWRVFFRKDRPVIERPTAVVQLSDERTILIIHISEMKAFPQKVKEVIESPDIVKTGANIRNDGEKLFRDFGIVAANLVELGALARQADPAFSSVFSRSIVSLARMVERYAHKIVDKGKVRTGNWEAVPLTQEQTTYAANDAHCALVVYKNLIEMSAKAGQSLTPASYSCGIKAADGVQGTSRGDSSAPHGSGNMSTSAARPVSGTSHTKSSGSSWSRPVAYAEYAHGAQAPPRPQHLRAYNLWHHREMPLEQICATLRSEENPLAHSTVISYVVWALQADPSLPFSTERLKALAQLEAGSWRRHREWIVQNDPRRQDGVQGRTSH